MRRLKNLIPAVLSLCLALCPAVSAGAGTLDPGSDFSRIIKEGVTGESAAAVSEEADSSADTSKDESLFAPLALSALGASALSVSSGTSSGTTSGAAAEVEDLADLMSWNEESTITQALQTLADKYDYDFIVVTTDDAEGLSAMRYAEQCSLKYGSRDDGVVYLIDMDNRELYVATYGQMEYVLTDSRIESLLDAGYSYLTNGAYARCFDAMVRRTDEYLRAGVPQGAYTYNTDNGEVTYYRTPNSISGIEAAIAAVIGLIAGGIFYGSVSGRYNMKSGLYRYDLAKHSRLNLSSRRDQFVHRIVTRHRIPRVNVSSGGGGSHGGGGGSSIHFGGGGRTYGGGGRKF